jgi:glyoxylase-like metal-dependent hydrolase (beta-lactamase superfamily II)
MPERLHQFRFDEQFQPTPPQDVTPAHFAGLRFPARTPEILLPSPAAVGRFVREAKERVFASSPAAAAEYLLAHVFYPFEQFDQEEAWVLLLNTKNEITVDGETEILPGIRLLPTPGHVPFHQSVLLESDGQRALFVADLIPTAAHLPLPWIMGYDVEPLVTLETKRRILRTSAEEDWLLVFEHDPRVAWGTVSAEGKHYRLVPRPDGQADASCVP